MKAIEEYRRVRLSIRMDCGEAEGCEAAEWFNGLRNRLAAAFPTALIACRQYDRAHYRRAMIVSAEPYYAAFGGARGAPFVVAHGEERLLCFHDEDNQVQACEISEDFARMWIEEFALSPGG